MRMLDGVVTRSHSPAAPSASIGNPTSRSENEGNDAFSDSIGQGIEARTAVVANVITDAFRQGRKVLVLTERTDHIDAIRAALANQVPEPFVLHGRMSKKQRTALIAALDALPPGAPRVLLATGKLVGEGFDHPPLDTLVLAMPVSWKGTLQQYAGRLHREHASKADVRIIDFVDTAHPALRRMWDKRQRGYRAMGYRIQLRSELAKSTKSSA